MPKTELFYTEGLCRNDQHKVVSHIYAGPVKGQPEGPLCQHGWNRLNGFGFSIFRGNRSDKGTCRVCLRRRNKELGPVPPKKRETRWL